MYVPTALDARMQRYHRDHHITAAQLVLRAISATYTQLTDLSNQPVVVASSPVQPSLFSGDTGDTPLVAARQVGVRLLANDIATIDRLAETAGAASRSAYVVAALTTFLNGAETGTDHHGGGVERS